MMNKEEMQTELRVHIARKYKTQTAAAKSWGLSVAFVSAVLTGRKNPNPTMLADMGLERVDTPVRFVKVKK